MYTHKHASAHASDHASDKEVGAEHPVVFDRIYILPREIHALIVNFYVTAETFYDAVLVCREWRDIIDRQSWFGTMRTLRMQYRFYVIACNSGYARGITTPPWTGPTGAFRNHT